MVFKKNIHGLIRIARGLLVPIVLLVSANLRADEETHWAWKPIHASIAHGKSGEREAGGNPIDHFIRQRLTSSGLTMSAEADRRTLIRRLTFDLHGLPPTPDEIQAFLDDQHPRAYERLVDRLLNSPHYGERWARHWLDIAHYADTHGFERDQRRDNAWRYRDWVIQALNSDKPYNEFLRDQIAGDVLRPDDPDAVIATAFLAAGPWDFVGQAETKSPVLKRAARADDLDDLVTQVMTAACGMTVNCARCHDHKLDPIPQKDYYALWAVFAGLKRAERDVSPKEVRELAERKRQLEAELQSIRDELSRRSGRYIHLADIVGGGNGRGTGKPGDGIDPLTGKPQTARRGFLEGVKPNQFVKSTIPFVDGLVIPDASDEGTPVSSTGLRIKGVPKTSGQVSDAPRFGPVHSQFSTVLGNIDYAANGHSLLSLHANCGITFDLAALRTAGTPAEFKFTTVVGYFGETPKAGAGFGVYLDGVLQQGRDAIGREDGPIAIEVPVSPDQRFLTLIATDAGNGIGHDQICFADAWLVATTPPLTDDATKTELARLNEREKELLQLISTLPAPSRVYSVVADASVPVINVLRRGDPEQSAEEVLPGSLTCVTSLRSSLGTAQSSDAERRIAFAGWVTSAENPLTPRVIVNRLWHYHFGTGLVDTPSDFGLGGSLPTHPELLDWLAGELIANNWSLKSMHRLICTSTTYRQVSAPEPDANSHRGEEVDANNRLLWKMNARRLDAESVRDAMLSVSGNLNGAMFGPGYRDFEYQEEYAPVYRYITPDSPELWRRSIYRFVVRTTTHQFLTTLDCPNPANLVPSRNVTTTALQSLAFLNNEFVLKQSHWFAQRLDQEQPSAREAQIERAFWLAFGRSPSRAEAVAAKDLIEKAGLPQLCRVLFNANEFVYVD